MASAARHATPYSGSWYPGDRSHLNELLEELFATSVRRTGLCLLPEPIAFVVPHAGLRYSGRVAASAYRHLERLRPQRVVLLGFAHHGSPPGLWIPEVAAYETPLGEVLVDAETVERLTTSGEVGLMPEGRLCDHSIEIQLPLLQRAAPDARLVPIYVSRLTAAQREQAARTMADLVSPGTVLLASSDLTHFGEAFQFRPFPVDSLTADRLRQLDETVIEGAGSLSANLFEEALRVTSATVCGREPIALLAAALRHVPGHEDIFQQTLDYETSGDITGDFSHSVSYAALGYFPYRSYRLGDEDQALLLESARRTLRRYQETAERRPVPPKQGTEALRRRCGVFVTLRRNQELRGCVGRCKSPEPLSTLVPELTLASALDDTRFEQITGSEEGIEIEISILSPMKRLADRAEFQVNRDGGYLETPRQSGLLLPQVAAGKNWASEQFLDALAQKAGVSVAAYQDPSTKLSVFRAQLIH